MKTKNLGIVVFLVAIAVTMGSASAATINVNSGMTNAQIQGNISAASDGDTINFASGTYNGISLTITKALNMLGNGANLVGNGGAIMTITSTTGLNITGFNININSNTSNGITGYNVVSCQIKDNNITNGGDAINIFKSYKDLTIDNNHITNMVNSHGDAISLVNHNATNIETTTSTRVTNNVIDNAIYGIFLGGNFQGTVSGNTVTNTQCGMNITGKQAASNGILNANITGNTITGIAMECPHVQYLNLDGNTVGQLGTTGYSLLTNTNFGKDTGGHIYNTNNNFGYTVDPVFLRAVG